jgi:hypothetical protein
MTDVFCEIDNVTCLTEKWLNVLCLDHNLFPNCYTVFGSDRKSAIKTRGSGVLIVINSKFRSFKHKYDLQFYEECVWIELPHFDGENLLTANHYFPPDTSPNTIFDYFSFLEYKLDTTYYRLILMGHFNTSGFDWKCGLPVPAIIILSLKERLYIPVHVFSD